MLRHTSNNQHTRAHNVHTHMKKSTKTSARTRSSSRSPSSGRRVTNRSKLISFIMNSPRWQRLSTPQRQAELLGAPSHRVIREALRCRVYGYYRLKEAIDSRGRPRRTLDQQLLCPIDSDGRSHAMRSFTWLVDLIKQETIDAQVRQPTIAQDRFLRQLEAAREELKAPSDRVDTQLKLLGEQCQTPIPFLAALIKIKKEAPPVLETVKFLSSIFNKTEQQVVVAEEKMAMEDVGEGEGDGEPSRKESRQLTKSKGRKQMDFVSLLKYWSEHPNEPVDLSQLCDRLEADEFIIRQEGVLDLSTLPIERTEKEIRQFISCLVSVNEKIPPPEPESESSSHLQPAMMSDSSSPIDDSPSPVSVRIEDESTSPYRPSALASVPAPASYRVSSPPPLPRPQPRSPYDWQRAESDSEVSHGDHHPSTPSSPCFTPMPIPPGLHQFLPLSPLPPHPLADQIFGLAADQ